MDQDNIMKSIFTLYQQKIKEIYRPNLPLKRKNNRTAKPIIIPPSRAEIGVKLIIFI